jgi:protein-tyrosine phosphatase
VTDPILDVTVEANGPQAYRLDWGPRVADGAITIYGGQTPSAIDLAHPLAAAVTAPCEVSVPHPGRWYFQLRAERGPGLIVTQRNVPLEGGTNFRDLGGYACEDGRRVQWGRLFRSGHLSHLSDAGKASFAALGINTVCDFRLPEERQHENASLPNSPHVETLSIPPGNDPFHLHRLFASSENPLVIVDAIHVMLRSFVLDCAPRYARMFDVLLNTASGGILLNCSAGKERTGVGAVLLLLALGVPRPTVRYDFMLSARYFPVEAEIDRVLRKYSVKHPNRDRAIAMIMPLLETRESYIDAVFAAIDSEYDSDPAYLQRALGLDARKLARLRDLYLG